MIAVAVLNGLPTPMNSSVFMGLSGMFRTVVFVAETTVSFMPITTLWTTCRRRR